MKVDSTKEEEEHSELLAQCPKWKTRRGAVNTQKREIQTGKTITKGSIAMEGTPEPIRDKTQSQDAKTRRR